MNKSVSSRINAPWFNMPVDMMGKLFPELSHRETEILILYFSGLDTASISHSLKISQSTVNNHLANAKFKFSAGSISELRSLILLRFLVCQVTSH
ncbi:helix-turn-helix transcriptional regulator [Citrobacter freundii]|nr:helix-turn-helix transcriptional regulator [Citrobacter freundii]